MALDGSKLTCPEDRLLADCGMVGTKNEWMNRKVTDLPHSSVLIDLTALACEPKGASIIMYDVACDARVPSTILAIAVVNAACDEYLILLRYVITLIDERVWEYKCP